MPVTTSWRLQLRMGSRSPKRRAHQPELGPRAGDEADATLLSALDLTIALRRFGEHVFAEQRALRQLHATCACRSSCAIAAAGMPVPGRWTVRSSHGEHVAGVEVATERRGSAG